MDLGVIECGEKQYRFAVSAGIGFDAAVCHQVNRSKLKKILNKVGLGKLTYLGVALNQMIRDTELVKVLIAVEMLHNTIGKLLGDIRISGKRSAAFPHKLIFDKQGKIIAVYRVAG